MFTEREKIDFLLRGRHDLNDGQRRMLRSMTSAAAVKAALEYDYPAPDTLDRAQQGTMASYLGRNAATPEARATQRAAMAEKFGRRTAPTAPYVEGRELVLPILTKAQARAVLERHHRDYGSDHTVPSRVALADTVANIGDALMAAARGGRVR